MSRGCSVRSVAFALSFLMLGGCGGGTALIANPQQTQKETLADPVPYTPGADVEPMIAQTAAARRLTETERNAEAVFAAELGDPNRIVLRHSGSTSDARRGTQNNVVGGNGEAVGLFTGSNLSASGSVVNIGVQKNYYVTGGGNFFHTHQFVGNQCFEYGINYSSQAPTLFAYNWCTGGNTPQGWINIGLVGDPGGVLNTWDATGNGRLFAWDSANGIYKISLEEIHRTDGWHLLGYNWKTTKFIDLMNGRGVTGTKNPCCGWSVFEIHVTPGASCKFDASFPVGQELLYDTKMKALINGAWMPLNSVSSSGFYYDTMIDCANISGQADPSFVGPYFSGGFVAPTAAAHAGDWWLIQR